MLEVYTLIATLIALGTIGIGIVGLIRPIQTFGMSTRVQAAGLVAFGLGVAVFAIIVIGVSAPSTPQRTKTAGGTPTIVAPEPKREAPFDQRNFVAAVISARNTYKAAPNEMAQGSIRVDRKRELCSLLRSFNVTGWEGTIYDLSSNNDGRGILAITIGPNIYVKTWNNAVSDYSDGTLLAADSAIYKVALRMRRNQKVAFSGTFLRGEKDCIKESSLTQSGAMLQPEFIMRFSDLSPTTE